MIRLFKGDEEVTSFDEIDAYSQRRDVPEVGDYKYSPVIEEFAEALTIHYSSSYNTDPSGDAIKIVLQNMLKLGYRAVDDEA